MSHAPLHALNQWRAHVAERAVWVERVSAAAQVWRGGQRAALCTWKRKHRAAAPARAAARRFLHAAASAAFRTWRDGYAARRSRARTSLQHWRRRGEVRAFVRLRELSRQRRLASVAAARLQNARRVRGFNSWAAARSDAAARRAKMRIAVGVLGGSKQSVAFRSWAAAALRRSAGKATLLRGVAAFRHRTARRGWSFWATRAAERRRRHAIMSDAAVALQGSRARKALRTWTAAVALPDCMPKAVLRWRQGALSKAFRAWGELWVRASLRRRALAGWRHGGLRRALVSWMHWLAERLERRARVEALLSRMANRPLLKAWNRWITTAGGWLVVDAAAQRAGRVARLQLARAFDTWYASHASVAMMRRALAHLAHRGLLVGMTALWDYAQSQELAARALLGWRSNGLQRGMNQWVAHTEQRLGMLAGMAEAVGTFRNTSLSRAWNSWVDAPPPLPVQSAKRMLHRALSRAIVTWMSATTRRIIMLNAFGGLCKREQRRALNAWASFVAERREALALTERALCRMASPLLKPFNAWAAGLALLGPLRAGLARLARQMEAKALGQWSAHASRRRDLRRRAASLVRCDDAHALRRWRAVASARSARLRRLEGKARAVLAGPLSKAVNTWRPLGRRYAIARRALSAMCLRRLGAGWRGWHAACTVARERRQRAQVALRKMSPRGRAQSKAVNAWKASAGFRRRQRASLARLRRQRETHAVHRWRAVSCEAAARREQLAVALHKLSPEGRAKRSALDQLRACVARAELVTLPPPAPPRPRPAPPASN